MGLKDLTPDEMNQFRKNLVRSSEYSYRTFILTTTRNKRKCWMLLDKIVKLAQIGGQILRTPDGTVTQEEAIKAMLNFDIKEIEKNE